MATIDDLPNPNFSDMTDEELMECIRGTRGRRMAPPPSVKAATKKVAIARQGKTSKKPKSKENVMSLIDSLTPEQRAQFMAQLGVGNK